VSIGLAFDLSGGYEVALWALAIAAFAAGAAIYRADRRP